jgi:hypothetical protein
MNNLTTNNYQDSILEAIKSIDTTKDWNVEDGSITKIIEEQKVYFWIRLFITEDSPSVEIGSDITITYKPQNIGIVCEELETKFICFGKKGLEKDNSGVINYTQEDDTRCLCLMIDSSKVNFNEDVPFIRTLFKTGYHYEYQVIRRSDLLFIDKKNNITLDYYDCDF